MEIGEISAFFVTMLAEELTKAAGITIPEEGCGIRTIPTDSRFRKYCS